MLVLWFMSTPLSLSAAPSPEATADPLDAGRIAQITEWLPEKPAGIGPTLEDRAAWDALAALPAARNTIAQAEAFLQGDFPAWCDEAYLDFSRTGLRPRGEAMMSARHRRLSPLVWAECLENRGRFIPAIEQALREYLSEPSWTLPAHDRDLSNFHGTLHKVDLHSASFAHLLAHSLYLLGDRLDTELQTTTRAVLRERIWDPVLSTLRTGRPSQWWLTATHNWNAVCLAGVVGSSLTALPDRRERALLAAAGEFYVRNFVDGFTDDGYCSEGLGYWNYGFVHFVELRASLHAATSGNLDLFSEPKVREIALFGPRIEVLPGVFPAIADCRFEVRAEPHLMAHLDKAFGLGLGLEMPTSGRLPRLTHGALHHFGVFPAPGVTEAKDVNVADAGVTAVSKRGIRSYFRDAGVLVCRPATAGGLGAVLKGGHNAEHHNHNDVGSFTLALGEGQPMGDVGGPHAYTSETFGPQRYTKFETFRSRNHPVPLLAGHEQIPGREAAAKVLEADFQPERDRFSLDLTAAYDVPGLLKITRSFEFTRVGSGSLEVRDDFAFDKPSTYETSLTTHGTWRKIDAQTLEFTHRGATVRMQVESPGDFDINEQRIQEDAPPFTRVGLRLREPLLEGTVILRFIPLRASM